MKNVFALDMTDGNNGAFDGQNYVTRTVSDEILEKNNNNIQKYEELERASALPLWAKIIKYVLLIAGIVLLAGIIKAVSGEGSLAQNFENGFENAPYIFILCPLLFIGFAVVKVYEKNKSGEVVNGEELVNLQNESDALIGEIKKELEIPEDAEKIDILCYAYKIDKTGENKQYSPHASHTPMQMYIYKDECNLYVANYNDVFAFPLSSVGEITEREEKISLICWNYDDDINEGRFAKYNMTYDNYGIILAKGYASLAIKTDTEEAEIHIPLYELEVLKALLEK